MRALLLVFCACGGAAATKPPAPAPAQPSAPVAAVTPDAFCDRFMKLQGDECAPFSQMNVTRERCVAELGNQAAFMNQAGTCIGQSQTCEAAQKCLAVLAPDPHDLRACNEDAPGKAVGMPKAEWDKRNGAGLTKFSQAHSTKELPLEVCTIDAENELLTTLTCEDGSRPIPDHPTAETARVGNLGFGGRCGSIIDLYRVKCPEASYDLYIDGYVCPQ
jgi:hypothetical protein